MKKFLLAVSAGTFVLSLNAQVCSPNPPDPNANLLGANPNPLATAFSFHPYDHQNTVVLPGKVDNTLTVQTGDSISLCGIRILSVGIDTASSYNQDVPPGLTYSYEVWQGNTQIDDSNDVINIPYVTTRICLRMKMQNPPAPVNSPCDSIAFEVIVRGSVDLDGPAPNFPCASVPNEDGKQVFVLKVPLCDSLFMGIADLQAEGFQVLGNFPNPAKEQTNILFNLPESGFATVTVFDATGRMVVNKEWMAQQGKNEFILDTSGFASGMYSYHIGFGGKTLSSKFSVTR